MATTTHYDDLVIGTGMGGLTVGALLAARARPCLAATRGGGVPIVARAAEPSTLCCSRRSLLASEPRELRVASTGGAAP